MGSRGPSKLPTGLKLLHGEKRDSRLNRGAPKPKPNRPVMPMEMSDEAKHVWRRIMRDFGQTGILTAVDADQFRAYCEAVARYRQAAMKLEQMGPLVRGAHRGDLVKNPLHQIVRDNADQVRVLARELGLTPSSLSGVHAFPGPVEDEFDRLLRRRRG